MKVEIQPDVRDTAVRLGAASYALKALAGQLADDPTWAGRRSCPAS